MGVQIFHNLNVNTNDEKEVRKKPCCYCGEKTHYTRNCPKTDQEFTNNYFRVTGFSEKYGYLHDVFLIIQNRTFLFDLNTSVNLTSLEAYADYGVLVYVTRDYKHLVVRYGRFRNEKMFVPIHYIREMT